MAEVEEEKVVMKVESVWEEVEKGFSELKIRLDGKNTVDGNRTADGELITELHVKIYTAVYNYCSAPKNRPDQEQVYAKYKELFVEYLDYTVLPSLRLKHDEYMLKELLNRWKNQGLMLRWFYRYFYYLDRFFLINKKLPSLNEAGTVCFRENVFEKIKGAVKDSVLKLINQEREGEQIDKALIKNIVDIFIDIGLGDTSCYKEEFEEYLLEESVKYYSRKASMWVQEDSCPEYLFKAEECYKREKERVGHYLHSKTEDELLKKVLHELISVHSNQLLEKEHSGCHGLLRDDKKEDLSRMFRLFSKVKHGLDPVSRLFKEHVTSEGMTLVREAEDAARNKQETKRNIVGLQEQVFMRKVIELHDKYMNCVVECFQNHNLFHKALQESFEVFCNKTVAGSSSAELLATFSDNILKKGGSEKLSDDALDETLDKVVKILSYINDKDLFAEFFRKKLARRLLHDKGASDDDHERSMLTKLKQQYGWQFTSKMEGMVTDITLAREKQKPFEEFLDSKNTKQLSMDLTVTTLTTGFWPTYKYTELNLPSEMVKCVEAFKEFYETTTNNRKLTWIYSLGTCHINAAFDSKNIELIVTTYQATALQLFNESERLNYSEIAAQLNLPDEDLIRVLHSLSCAKYKILIKEPNTKTVSRNDTFSFNSKFTDRMNRIKVPPPPVNEKKKVTEDVNKDRRYAIDAAIVRVMKSRKVLDHQQLVVECVKQLAHMFKPDIKVIKKSVEDLIVRDYLERDKENPNLYRYLA